MDPQARLARILELERELRELREDEARDSEDDKVRAIQMCRDLKSRGRPIEAVKHYRSMFGTGLLEAKDAVDAL